MNRVLIDKLAAALLYEGYVLYPYRPSVKNKQRWTFGGIYPQAWSEAQNGAEPYFMQTECLLEGSTAKVRVIVRFLQLIERTVGK
jgi:hydrogenase maturation protease